MYLNGCRIGFFLYERVPELYVSIHSGGCVLRNLKNERPSTYVGIFFSILAQYAMLNMITDKKLNAPILANTNK